MPSAKITAAVAGAALASGALIASAAPALAAIGGAHTPGARAAAVVNADGTVARSTGVTAVRKLATGQYCVQLDPDIDAAKAVPVATKRWGSPWSSTVFVTPNASACGDAARHVFIGSGTPSGAADLGFHLIVD
ncbi:hypothetical protein [Thermomonospora umbrina]|uniref:Uncharacterized protein n=1 Tax=Thermomonospora umbrina TaxID=111806 RepID=A0A3D9SL56_9ACTN|nr:hypothetical protein [Thermomonospora umbrina]REE96662.1 hypothetical protein DFJ69_2106 [Thermomonospora umbrina]